MKRVKKASKFGFTLLEVLLATVIMVMASTMIMKGFIAVMILANNNARFSKSGEDNYRLAMSETLSQNATSKSQQDVITRLSNGEYTELTSTHPDVPNIVVQVSTYSDPTAPVFNDVSSHVYQIDSDAIDATTSVNNRFAFFYDFGDYLHVDPAAGHILRWGYIFSETPTTDCTTPIYIDYDGDGLVGALEDEEQREVELVGYGNYGWYCFNDDASHFRRTGAHSDREPNNACPYRTSAYTIPADPADPADPAAT